MILTDRQREILTNALGLLAQSKPYRNRFVTGPGCDNYADVQVLVAVGLMVQGRVCRKAVSARTQYYETYYFFLTLSGFEAVGMTYDEEL